MGIRHLARQRAIQLLYALEFAGPDDTLANIEQRFLAADPAHRRGWGPFARDLAHQTHEKKAELDEAIRPTLRNWKLERLPVVERLCLRLALCELAWFPDIPMRVTINEYIELTRMFGNDDSPLYINAVLDTLARAFPEKDFQVHGEEPEEDPRPDRTAVLRTPEPPQGPLPTPPEDPSHAHTPRGPESH